MNRRAFLAGLVTTAAGLLVPEPRIWAMGWAPPPVVPNLIRPLMAGELGVWEGVRFVTQRFDYGAVLGMAGLAKNTVTGEERWRGVRLTDGPGMFSGPRVAKQLLDDWIADGCRVADPPARVAAIYGRHGLVPWGEDDA
ncbi:MAG TPA: hypothetical protein VFD43_09100 [Planctomycetota bacterium]|nr:hypothetical protein [Planctomycetota bacterium]